MAYARIMPWERVVWQKPDFPTLTQDYRCVDMHHHSVYSDSHSAIRKIAKKAGRLGIGIALTDHQHYQGNEELAKLHDFVIPGMELTISEGSHMLLYFYTAKDLKSYYEKIVKPAKGKNPFLKTSITYEQLLKHASAYNMVWGPAHPFAPGANGFFHGLQNGQYDPKTIRQMHFIEGFNGQQLPGMNLKGMKFAYETGKPIIGGSDAHILRETGRILTCAKADTPAAFLDAIRKDRIIVYGTPMGISQKIAPTILTLKKHVRYVPPMLRKKLAASFGQRVKYYKNHLR